MRVTFSLFGKRYRYTLFPHCWAMGKSYVVTYYVAYNHNQERSEWAVGPDRIDDFEEHGRLFAWAAGLFFGLIPRGRGKAPEQTRPSGQAAQTVVGELEKARDSAARLQDRVAELRRSPARMRHFVFGDLSPYQWVRVGHIHHRHHRAIIDDILQRA